MSEEVGAGVLGKSVNPIWTRGQILPTILPPRFLDDAASLTNICNVGMRGKNSRQKVSRGNWVNNWVEQNYHKNECFHLWEKICLWLYNWLDKNAKSWLVSQQTFIFFFIRKKENFMIPCFQPIKYSFPEGFIHEWILTKPNMDLWREP